MSKRESPAEETAAKRHKDLHHGCIFFRHDKAVGGYAFLSSRWPNVAPNVLKSVQERAGVAVVGGYTVDRRTNLSLDDQRKAVYDATWAKFSQNPVLRKLLLDTGDAHLHESVCGGHETAWTLMHNAPHTNDPHRDMSGKILMQVRTRLRPPSARAAALRAADEVEQDELFAPTFANAPDLSSLSLEPAAAAHTTTTWPPTATRLNWNEGRMERGESTDDWYTRDVHERQQLVGAAELAAEPHTLHPKVMQALHDMHYRHGTWEERVSEMTAVFQAHKDLIDPAVKWYPGLDNGIVREAIKHVFGY